VAKPAKKPDHSESPATRRVLPMELQVGDRLADETGEWEIVTRPATTVVGKTVSQVGVGSTFTFTIPVRSGK
jgi:hypothetical protein